MGIWCINPDIKRPSTFYVNRCLDENDPCDLNESMIGAYHTPGTQMCLDYTGNRFRAMEYLQSTNKLLIATMSNKLYSFDPVYNMQECSQIFSFKTAIQEMVAIRKWPIEPHSFAVGGQARFAVYDSRKHGEGMNILALNQSAGIRSLAFKDFVISYGTAEGHINFFDLRAKRHLDISSFSQAKNDDNVFDRRCSDRDGVGTSSCPLLSSSFTNLLQLRMEAAIEPSDIGRMLSHNQTAIYTHEYDPTSSKLFAAGGPIAACHSGQAACLFE